MERDKLMSFRLPAPVQDALRRAAEDEQRSVSNLVVRIMTEWLVKHGHLSKAVRVGKKRS